MGQPRCDLPIAAGRQGGDPTSGGLRYPIVLVEPHVGQSGAPIFDASPSASRLADALAGRPSTTAELAEDATKAPNQPLFTPPVVAGRRTGTGALARTLIVGGAVAGGFVLGLCIHGGIPLSGIELRGALLDLDARAPERSAKPRTSPSSAPTALPRTLRSAAVTAPASAFVQSLAGGSDQAGQGANGGALESATGWPGPLPTSTAPQVQGYEARAENGAAINGTPHPEPSSSASAHRPAAVHANAAPWDVLYARGHQFQLEGNLVAAAAAYRQAIQLNPQHAAALYDLGYVLQLQGETEAAIEYYQGAIAHQPRHAFAHYNLGTLLQAKGDAKGAIAHYEAAAAIQPENPYIYYDWARSLEAIGDAAGAAARYRKAIALDPDHRPGLDARQRLALLATLRIDQAPTE